jgi:acetyl esterase
MPLAPVLRELVEAARAMGPVDRSHLPVAEQRRRGLEDLAKLFRDAGERGPALERVWDRAVPGPNGDVPVRIYRPPSTAPLPLHVYFHGGGWWTGDLEMVDDECRHRAHGVPCVVVSVDYRLAPEHPFPAPLDDCFAATLWTCENGASLGGDASRLSVGGASAGANLAAAVALRARDGGAPPLAYQVLECPAFDPELASASMRELGDDYMLTRDGLAVAWGYYLSRPEDRADPYAAPLRAGDLRGLPPALVVTAEYDPLRDEGEEYGRRLASAGVPVRVTRYPGVLHGFGGLTRVLEQARACRAEINAALAAASGADARDRGGRSTSR